MDKDGNVIESDEVLLLFQEDLSDDDEEDEDDFDEGNISYLDELDEDEEQDFDDEDDQEDDDEEESISNSFFSNRQALKSNANDILLNNYFSIQILYLKIYN